MLDLRPEMVPIKRTAELPIVALHAIAGREGTKMERCRRAGLALSDVNASWAMTTLATDLGQFRGHVFPAVAAGFAEADGMATDA